MERNVIKTDVEIIHKLFENLKIGEINSEERMGGLTNHTYKVTTTDKKEYVVRIPGEGTEEIINRSDEKISNQLACKLGIDSEVIYFDEVGFKISKYIPNAKTGMRWKCDTSL